MPIVGLGTDLVATSRIERLISRNETIFRDRILGNGEREEISVLADRHYRVTAYGQSIAAKEALLKALGSGLAQDMLWSDIQLVKRRSATPKLQISGQTKNVLASVGANHVSISFSTLKTTLGKHVQATVILSHNLYDE